MDTANIPMNRLESYMADRNDLFRLIGLSESLSGACKNTVNDMRAAINRQAIPNESLMIDRINLLDTLSSQTQACVDDITKRLREQ